MVSVLGGLGGLRIIGEGLGEGVVGVWVGGVGGVGVGWGGVAGGVGIFKFHSTIYDF